MTKFRFDQKEYELETLPETVKVQIVHLQAAEMEIARLRMLLALTQTAHASYGRAVKQELAKLDAGGEPHAQPPAG